VISMPCIRHNL